MFLRRTRWVKPPSSHLEGGWGPEVDRTNKLWVNGYVLVRALFNFRTKRYCFSGFFLTVDDYDNHPCFSYVLPYVSLRQILSFVTLFNFRCWLQLDPNSLQYRCSELYLCPFSFSTLTKSFPRFILVYWVVYFSFWNPFQIFTVSNKIIVLI